MRQDHLDKYGSYKMVSGFYRNQDGVCRARKLKWLRFLLLFGLFYFIVPGVLDLKFYDLGDNFYGAPLGIQSYSGADLIIDLVLAILIYANTLSIHRGELTNGIFCGIEEVYKGSHADFIPKELFVEGEESVDTEIEIEALSRFIIETARLYKQRIWNGMIVLSVGLYLIFRHPDISTGYFLIGSEIVLFEAIFLPIHIFSRKPIDLLKMNPRWPKYLKILGIEAIKTDPSPTPDRYTREVE